MIEDEFNFTGDRFMYFVTIDNPIYNTQTSMMESEVRAFLKLSEKERCPIDVSHDGYGSFTFYSAYIDKTVCPDDLKKFIAWFDHLKEDITNSPIIEAIIYVKIWQDESFGYDNENDIPSLIKHIRNYPKLLENAGYSFDKLEDGKAMIKCFQSEIGREPNQEELNEINEAILTHYFESDDG